MDKKLIQNRFWEGHWAVLGASWEVFGRLLVLGWCLGGSGGVFGSILEALGRIWELKWSGLFVRNRRKTIENADLNLVSILEFCSFFEVSDLDFVLAFHIRSLASQVWKK